MINKINNMKGCKDYGEYRKEEIFRIFRRGFRVLVVDDDRVCSRVLEKMLMGCLYHVTIKGCAKDALSLLREQKNEFDIVISDVHMPEMDGFSLLEHVALEIDLPVVMVSADDDKRAVMKGVTRGACDYLIKPVRIEALRNIWQHVLRKKKIDLMKFDRLGGFSKWCHLATNEAGNSLEGSSRNLKRKKENEIRTGWKGDNSLKKRRVVWAGNLHNNFVSAVNKLGLQKAVPKKILELMSTPGLTRENVASHLQKFRLYIRKLGEGNPVPRHPNALIIKPEEANLGSVDSPYNGIQNPGTLYTADEILAEELATFDPRNPFSTESCEEEEEKHHFSNNEPMELLHGIPISAEPRQFENICQSMQPFRPPDMQVNPCLSRNSEILIQATQQVCRPCCVINRTSTSHVPRPIVFHEYQEDLVNTHIKEPKGFSYDIFNELNQLKSKELFSSNQVLSYNASQHAVLPSVLVNQDSVFTGQNIYSPIGGALAVPNISQQLNTSHVENCARDKAGNILESSYQNTIYPESSYQNTVYPCHLVQEDLATALLNQQEGIESQGVGELEGDFGFMDSSFDSLPM